MSQSNDNKQWLSSKETQRALKITGCQLMHLRESGKLQFKKVGRSYFYLVTQNTN